MVTADHGPAVSGAHNTIVCARAGKDLVSSLASGLLTIVRFTGLLELFKMNKDFQILFVVHVACISQCDVVCVTRSM